MSERFSTYAVTGLLVLIVVIYLCDYIAKAPLFAGGVFR